MTFGHSKAFMSLPNRIYLYNGGSVQAFARIGSLGSESNYVQVGDTEFPGRTVDTIQFRSTVKGPVNSPAKQRKTYNIRREIGMPSSTPGESNNAVANFTLTTPGGNVLDDSQLNALILDVVTMLTSMNDISDALNGAQISDSMSSVFLTTAKIQEV